MKNLRIKLTVFSVLSIFVIFILVILLQLNKNITINNQLNFKKIEDQWKVSLNINPANKCTLIIEPAREDFVIPKELQVTVLMNKVNVYSEKLTYVPNKNIAFWGKFKDTFYIDKNMLNDIKELQIKIKYNEKIVDFTF